MLASALPTRADLERLCRDASKLGFRSVAVASGLVSIAQTFLDEGEVKLSCYIGHPLGSGDPDAKRYETEVAIDAGASEIEVVPSLAKLKDADYKAVLRELRDIVEAADERPVKVQIEPVFWNSENLHEIVQMVLDSGAHYICTSSTSRSVGEVVDEVKNLRQLVGPKFGLKASLPEGTDSSDMVLAAGADIIGVRHSPTGSDKNS